jgi:hypothetical protein
VILAFPGQPGYRQVLGKRVPPPRIQFDGFTFHAKRPGPSAIATLAAQLGVLANEEYMTEEDMTFKPVFDEFDPRFRRFRHAEYAVSLGLPATTFN